MNLPQTGGCLCRKIRYEITETPQLVYTCHCTACQHQTSSAFSLGVAVPETGFRLTSGEPRALQRVTDSGRLNSRFVCPDCASWLYSQPRGGVVRVRAGSLDDAACDAAAYRLLDCCFALVCYWQCAPKARITSGGRIHPESCRLIW